jgi:hypothetical protein
MGCDGRKEGTGDMNKGVTRPFLVKMSQREGSSRHSDDRCSSEAAEKQGRL